jgi:hypothetical protein
MNDLSLTGDFPMWFGGMLGMLVNKDASKQAASYVPIVQQVVQNAKVFPLP